MTTIPNNRTGWIVSLKRQGARRRNSCQIICRTFHISIIFASTLALTACLGGTTSSTYDRQLFAESKYVEPLNPKEVDRQTAQGEPTEEQAQAEHLPLSVASSQNEDEALIDQLICISGLSGDLATATAGDLLLASGGLSDNNKATNVARGAISAPKIVVANHGSPAPSAGAAEQAENSSVPLSQLSASLSSPTESILMSAYEQSGRRYKAGGQHPAGGFDAAGFTTWVYAQRGIKLPVGAPQQAAGGKQVAKEELRPGDILVYRNAAGSTDDYHVGIYTGQGNFLHASPNSGVVTETAAFGPQFLPNFVGGRRYYDDPSAAPLSDSRKMAAASRAVKLALSELGPEDKPDRSVSRSKTKKKK